MKDKWTLQSFMKRTKADEIWVNFSGVLKDEGPLLNESSEIVLYSKETDVTDATKFNYLLEFITEKSNNVLNVRHAIGDDKSFSSDKSYYRIYSSDCGMIDCNSRIFGEECPSPKLRVKADYQSSYKELPTLEEYKKMIGTDPIKALAFQEGERLPTIFTWCVVYRNLVNYGDVKNLNFLSEEIHDLVYNVIYGIAYFEEYAESSDADYWYERFISNYVDKDKYAHVVKLTENEPLKTFVMVYIVAVLHELSKLIKFEETDRFFVCADGEQTKGFPISSVIVLDTKYDEITHPEMYQILEQMLRGYFYNGLEIELRQDLGEESEYIYEYFVKRYVFTNVTEEVEDLNKINSF